MKIGADYSPEAFDESEWERDLAAGRAIGLSAIRCGANAWSTISPADGDWDANWCERFLLCAESQGYDVIWQTPSSNPPPWVFDRWPELAGDGRRRFRGYCLSHSAYLALCAETAGKLQTALGGSLALAGWEIANGPETIGCECPACASAFRQWLQERYGSLDALNKRWRTASWGQTYSRWEQIPVLTSLLGEMPPSPILLGGARFRASQRAGHIRAQALALRSAGSGRVCGYVRHGLTQRSYDCWALDDVLSVRASNYTLGNAETSVLNIAVGRGERPGSKPLWVTQIDMPSDTAKRQSWREVLDFCAVSEAEYAFCGVLRQLPSSNAPDRQALLTHAGLATAFSSELGQAIPDDSGREGVLPDLGVYFVYSFEQLQALSGRSSHPGTAFDIRAALSRWYAATGDAGVVARVGGYEGISGLEETIIAPHQSLREPGVLKVLHDAVVAGATLVTTVDFGWCDDDGNIVPEPPLHLLSLWGGQAPDIEIVRLSRKDKLAGRLNGVDVSASHFAALSVRAAPRGARYEEIGRLEGDGLQVSAVLRTRIGQGQVYVALADFDRAGIAALISLACATL
ncbi:MAG: beta-galactosidase [Capsulimonadaceae bacterium]|nr:beta-galactosidase [Capsulimonadaceae bacterium]